MTDNKRNVNFDILNTAACLMVVFFHCNTIFYKYSDTLSWKISVAERCIVYSAVPIFFMLTGANLMNYREKYSTKEFFKKRAIRTVIPFIFWNLFYIGIDFVYGGFAYKNVTEFISAFLNSEIQNRYWFFFPLFAIYAVIPFFSLLLKVPNHRKYLWYLVASTFITLWLIKPIFMILGIQYNNYSTLPFSAGFLMYAVFGYLVATEDWKKKYRLMLYAATLLSEIFVIFYTIRSSALAGQTNQFMVSYQYFPSALMGASIFVFFTHLNTEKVCEKTGKLLRTLARCNMGVWLTHSIAILIIEKVTSLPNESYILRFAVPFIIYIGCVIGTFVVKKLPLVKYIV